MAKKMATKRSDDELREILRAVPQRIVGEMCGGRQTVHLQRVANRWGIPLAGDGGKVDLFAVLARLWLFLKDYAVPLAAIMNDSGEDGDDDTLGVRYLRAKTAKTEAEAKMVQLKFEKEDGSVCSREMMHDLLAPLANRIRTAGEQAQRNWGDDGFDLFHQIEVATREASALLKAKDSAPNAVEAGSAKTKRSSRTRRGPSKAKAKQPGRSRRGTSK